MKTSVPSALPALRDGLGVPAEIERPSLVTADAVAFGFPAVTVAFEMTVF